MRSGWAEGVRNFAVLSGKLLRANLEILDKINRGITESHLMGKRRLSGYSEMWGRGSLPFYGRWWFGGDVVGDAVDAAHCVDDLV